MLLPFIISCMFHIEHVTAYLAQVLFVILSHYQICPLFYPLPFGSCVMVLRSSKMQPM